MAGGRSRGRVEWVGWVVVVLIAVVAVGCGGGRKLFRRQKV